jgi:hypothetical protein
MNIPCETCLVFPLCKERLRQIDKDPHSEYKGAAGWVILKGICRMVKDHLHEIQYYGVWNKNLGEFEGHLLRVFGDAYKPSIKYHHYKVYKLRAI